MNIESDNESGDESKPNGYCHFNENGNDLTFSIDLLGYNLILEQNPLSNIGHGAVVWDASVVFSKYVEHNPSTFNRANFNNKKVIELGSGCGLGGLCLMLKGAHVVMTDLPSVIEVLTTQNAMV